MSTSGPDKKDISAEDRPPVLLSGAIPPLGQDLSSSSFVVGSQSPAVVQLDSVDPQFEAGNTQVDTATSQQDAPQLKKKSGRCSIL